MFPPCAADPVKAPPRTATTRGTALRGGPSGVTRGVAGRSDRDDRVATAVARRHGNRVTSERVTSNGVTGGCVAERISDRVARRADTDDRGGGDLRCRLLRRRGE